MSGLSSSAARSAERLAASRVGSRFVLDPLLDWGWRRYRANGTTPALAFRAMRASFLDPTTSFGRLEVRASEEYPPLAFAPAPSGLVSDSHEAVLEELVRDGFAVLPALLSVADCDDIEACARAATCTLIGAGAGTPAAARFDETAPLARRYEVPEADLLACTAVQALLGDESLLRLAQEYLGASPVHDLVAGWWSAPGAGSASQAAQLFHFDLDRPRFLKLFVYLSDVGPETGPHAYVRGTHRELPVEFRADRRYSDEEVERRFKDEVVRIPGPRGTVFLADTRGLHKGEPVISGHRLIFQLELASSLFGGTYTRPVLHAPAPGLSEATHRFPSAYRRFTVVED